MDLSNHNFKQLKQLAKQHKLPYNTYLHKSELMLYLQLTFSQIYKECCICLNTEIHTIQCSCCSCITCTKCDEHIKLCPQCRIPNPSKLTNVNILFYDDKRKQKVALTKNVYELIKSKSSLRSFKQVEDVIINNINSTNLLIEIPCWLL